MKHKILSGAIYCLSASIGVIAFVYPFLIPAIRDTAAGQAHATDAPLVLTALVSVCFVVLLFEVQGQAINAKLVALLGILVAMNSVLRFVEVAIPGPGGISLMFFLIIMTGYVYGGRFGFLMGALSLFVSALVTGSVGPWLPYQMFTAAWVGMTAPLCRPLVRGLRAEGRWGEVLILALLGAMWGFLFGAIMNVWFWPFAVGPADQYWEPGVGLAETLRRYAAFYVTTSLAWDVLRVVGNVTLILAFGAPTLRVLRRFGRRFAFDHQPVLNTDGPMAHAQAFSFHQTRRDRRRPVDQRVASR